MDRIKNILIDFQSKLSRDAILINQSIVGICNFCSYWLRKIKENPFHPFRSKQNLSLIIVLFNQSKRFTYFF